MKGLFLLGLLSASIFLGNSQAHASVDSVGVIGPNGSVLHVSQNISGKILLQRCTPYTVLAKTVNEAQRTCSPVTWQYFSKETLRNIIRDSIIKFELKNLKTLSQAEINSCTNLNGFERMIKFLKQLSLRTI